MTKAKIGDTGTLDQLGVQAGDVVECILNSIGHKYDRENPFTVDDKKDAVNKTEAYDKGGQEVFKLISRATPHPPILYDISVEMVDRIKDVIYDYSDRANLVTVLGVLDIVSRELWSEQSGE